MKRHQCSVTTGTARHRVDHRPAQGRWQGRVTCRLQSRHCKSVPLEATVDTGATYTMIQAHVLDGLSVPILERRPFELADGRLADYAVGETKIRVDGRVVTTLVVFGGDNAAPVLGACAPEDLGLGMDPLRRRLVPVRGLLL